MMLTEVISSIGEAGLAAVTGYAVVFFGIILLMAVVSIRGKSMQATQKTAAPAPVPAQNDAPSAQLPTAPGTAGKLKLYDTDPKTAAMLMAIVADKMGKPINELRFISIKEVK